MTDKELVQSLKQCVIGIGCDNCGLRPPMADLECRFDLMLLAADRLEALLPPFKIGDTAWGVQLRGRYGPRVLSGPVARLGYNDEMELCASVRNVGMGKIGEKIFQTEEEAKKALEKILEETPWKG